MTPRSGDSGGRAAPRGGGGGGNGSGGRGGHDVIVIGASAGGVEALLALARGLPADLAAAVLVVIHTSPTAPGFLSGLVDRAGPLPAGYAVDGEVALPGRIYLAPPDHHLLLEAGGRMRVWRGPKENGFRPAIDPLFRSAARAVGARAVGAILSGYLDDGTLGLMLLKRRGGVAVVQDPATAACPEMPRSAMSNVAVDHVVPIEAMPALFVRLASEPPNSSDALDPPAPPGATGGRTTTTTTTDTSVTTTTLTNEGDAGMTADICSGSEDGPGDTTPNTIERKQATDGAPSALTCPECGGALWERRVDSVMRYSCHVGHGYTGETLEDQYVREVEAALWTAMRHLMESAELHRRLATRMRESGPAERAADYEQRAVDTERRAQVIRDLLVNGRVGGVAGLMEARSVRAKPE